MTAHAFNPATNQAHHTMHRSDLPVPVLVVSTIAYATFALVVTIIALDAFPPGGVALAIVLGWRGGFVPGLGRSSAKETVEALSPSVPASVARPSGNSSFDAYRDDMLKRLETEQDNFENFLGRLRDAKDQTEFDRFMDERAQKSVTTRQRELNPISQD